MENNSKDLNQCADQMLNSFVQCFNDLIKDIPQLKSAIVQSVNENGTVNITLPGNEQNIYKNIQNQSIFQDLQPGDGVELLLKGGNFSNCWIIAKHLK